MMFRKYPHATGGDARGGKCWGQRRTNPKPVVTGGAGRISGRQRARLGVLCEAMHAFDVATEDTEHRKFNPGFPLPRPRTARPKSSVEIADLECYANFAAVLAESGQKAGPI
jgi:hypothetical protein